METRKGRAVRPSVESMEGRELLSGLMVALSGPSVPSDLAAQIASSRDAGVNGGTSSGITSPLIGQGTPTPREAARQAFHAYFSGPEYIGQGRFSDQAAIIFFRGLGGSNQFLHGDYSMAIVIPKDPTAPLTGEAVLEDKNTNSSGIVGLVLKPTSPETYDKQGRPTTFTFTADPSIYSGIYFVDTAAGTLNIHYSKGSATATFHGFIYTNGLTSPLRNSDLYSRGGRITPRGGRAG